MALAVLNGLALKYPCLIGDWDGEHSDIKPAEESGLYTLCFIDLKHKRFKGTNEVFGKYSNTAPLISRGEKEGQVLIAYQLKKDAITALSSNVDNEDFPMLHVAHNSRG